MTPPVLDDDQPFAIAHVELYVGDARLASECYRMAYGLEALAPDPTPPPTDDRVSFAIGCGEMRLVFTSSSDAESPVGRHVATHGDGVRDVAFRVADARRAYRRSVERGAVPVEAPDKRQGSGLRGSVTGIGGLLHSFVECRDGDTAMRATEDTSPLLGIDHLAIALAEGMLEPAVAFYRETFGLTPMHAQDVRGQYGGMTSIALANRDGRVRLVFMEPVAGSGAGQIKAFLASNRGPGVQHLAFRTADIVETARSLARQGIGFLPLPAAGDDDAKEKMGVAGADPTLLRRLGIAVAQEGSGRLFQGFTRPLHARPTFFIEVIQRDDADGFGAGNVRALFGALERDQPGRSDTQDAAPGDRPWVNVDELEQVARAKMAPAAWDYVAGGSDDEVTLRENRAAFSRWRLLPRVLRGVGAVDTGTTVLGRAVSLPILLAPVGHLRVAHDSGEVAAAKAARACGTVFVASTMASTRIEDIAAAIGGPSCWFQVYVFRDRAVTASLIRRAEAAGYAALVLTVDAPCLGRRERDLRHGFQLPPGIEAANLPRSLGDSLTQHAAIGASAIARHAVDVFEDALDWGVLSWLREISTLPIVVKGVLTADDARLAVEHGAAAVVVSNHGGRQLDTVPATIDVLPEIVAAVAERCEVYLDGGVRRGVDVVKALALGARAVLVGRAYVWGLAADGEAGVGRVLHQLAEETATALALLGCRGVEELRPAMVRS